FRLSDAELIEVALAGAGGESADAVRAELDESSFVRVGPPLGEALFAEGNFPTPTGKFELASPSLTRAGHGSLPAYIPPAESPATQPDLAARFPLRLLTLKRHHSINSSYGGLPVLRRAEPEPLVEIHPDDAAPRGLIDGRAARVWNDRGAVEYQVRLTDRVRPGTVVVPFGHWLGTGPGVNALTSDRLSDIGNGPTFCDTLVEVSACGDGTDVP
ncbi:MAG TPA: molybdopterin dinucleotide binding domain-containing protein, partial [Dehalococcoidia bacterium]|nr:molybdopterin dinucleotide binding domain-containing protein [Dehalococcoidia bacterium]